MGVRFAASLLALALVSQACNDRYDTDEDERVAGRPADTAASRPTGPAAAGAESASLIAMGDRIYHGTEAGGTCFSCHGPDAKGTATGPDLTDSEWINTEGTKLGIASVIKTGVGKPQKYPAPMPPFGGARLNDEQVNALAGYVYSLSQK
jgi:mono/diheme cytochrome c family protein